MAQVQICRGFGDKDWEALSRCIKESSKDADWQRAISVFERRMDERFFSCIANLHDEGSDPPTYVEIPDTPDPLREPAPNQGSAPGFAIIAICCLLIDTLQFFREGEPPSVRPQCCPQAEDDKCGGKHPGSTQAIRVFLAVQLEFTDDASKKFANGIRHKLVHRAETNGWIIRRNTPDGKLFDCTREPYILNRTVFCDALARYFERYVKELRDGKNKNLRKNFLDAMDHVAKTCRKTRAGIAARHDKLVRQLES